MGSSDLDDLEPFWWLADVEDRGAGTATLGGLDVDGDGVLDAVFAAGDGYMEDAGWIFAMPGSAAR